MNTRKFETQNYIVSFDDTLRMHDQVFDALIAWHKKHEAFNGESICQCDDPSIDAMNIVSDIADEIIKFKTELK